jgi:hypothetical protein
MYYYRDMQNTSTFQRGDRVYSVAYPEWTGTVQVVADGAEYPLTVRWDDGSLSWHQPAQLDYWTRPESARETLGDWMNRVMDEPESAQEVN